MMNQRNPFKVSDNSELANSELANIADQTKVNRKSVKFLLKSTELGSEMYRKYYETHFEQKFAKLFENIPKNKENSQSQRSYPQI